MVSFSSTEFTKSIPDSSGETSLNRVLFSWLQLTKAENAMKKKNALIPMVQIFSRDKNKKSHLFPDGFFLSFVTNTMGFESDLRFGLFHPELSEGSTFYYSMRDPEPCFVCS